MLEKQKAKEIEAERMNVLNIDLEKGTATLAQETTEENEFAFQNTQVNEFMAKYAVGKQLNAVAASSTNKFKPFEFESGLDESEQPQDVLKQTAAISMKASSMADEKTQSIYD